MLQLILGKWTISLPGILKIIILTGVLPLDLSNDLTY